MRKQKSFLFVFFSCIFLKTISRTHLLSNNVYHVSLQLREGEKFFSAAFKLCIINRFLAMKK